MEEHKCFGYFIWSEDYHKLNTLEDLELIEPQNSIIIYRFNYCPECGKKIDWEQIEAKRGE